MKNIKKALTESGISRIIHVTTVISTAALQKTYPPSRVYFRQEIFHLMREIGSVLSSTNSPLMVSVYPYFDYASDPSHISLEYATFDPIYSPVVTDGYYQYTNMFDETVDKFNVAWSELGDYEEVEVQVAETGWPTRGNPPYTSVENARAYNQGLLKKLTEGIGATPRKPDVPVVTFFSEMFNEDLKEGEVEKSFGFFTPDMVPIYDMWNLSSSS